MEGRCKQPDSVFVHLIENVVSTELLQLRVCVNNRHPIIRCNAIVRTRSQFPDEFNNE